MNPEKPGADEGAAEALREAAGDPAGAVTLLDGDTDGGDRADQLAAVKSALKENPVVEWAKAIALGLRDTANDVVAEGRRGARSKQSQMWDKFDAKTKHRRG